MGRKSHTIPPIVALVALNRLYCNMKDLPDPKTVLRGKYFKKMSETMIIDGILENDNPSFLKAFCSLSGSQDLKWMKGIAVGILDKIAYRVINHFKLMDRIETNLDLEKYPWTIFMTKIFPTPPQLVTLEQKNFYYMHLKDTEKKLFDDAVMFQCHELGLSQCYKLEMFQNQAIVYVVYRWNAQLLKVVCSVLMIDERAKTASYRHNDSSHEMMISYNYQQIGAATFIIDCKNTGLSNTVSRANFMIGIFSERFDYVSTAKGILSFSENGATRSIACEVVLVKMDSYLEAIAVVNDDTKKDPAICLEVMNQSIAIKSSAIRDHRDLITYPTSRNLTEISGYYLATHLVPKKTSEDSERIYKVLIRIETNGMVTLQLSNQKDRYQAYVTWSASCSSHFEINPFPDSYLQDKFSYKLRLGRNFGATYFKHFIGLYTGSRGDVFFRCDTAFIKLDGVHGLKRTESYTSFDEALADNSLDPIIDTSPEKREGFDLVDQKAFELLTSALVPAVGFVV